MPHPQFHRVRCGGFPQRHIDAGRGTALRLTNERRHHREGCREPGSRVAKGDAGLFGPAIDMTGHRRETRKWCGGGPVSHVFGQWAGVTETGHRGDDHVGVGVTKNIVAETKSFHDAGRVVVDDDIG